MSTVIVINGGCDPAVLRSRLTSAAVHAYPDLDSIPAAVANAADALVLRSGAVLSAATLDRFPALAHVVRAGSGVDNIDVAALDRRGVRLHRNPVAGAAAVAEWALAASMALARRMPLGQAGAAIGEHLKKACLGQSLSQCRAAVWGGGQVGQAVGRALGPVVADLAYNRWPSHPDHLPQRAEHQLAAWADLHVVALPLTSSTTAMFGAEFLHRAAACRPMIVCVGRVETIDPVACLAALRSGDLSGLAVDAVEARHLPLFDTARRPLNLLVTPHIGAQRADVRRALDRWVADRLAAAFTATPAGRGA
ncbi:MAG: hydroxyacid dehydrogenase [Pseudonocardia sp.]|nr:hydroxyacid dehydrogenase [Pseudonocardia sp.]